MDHKGLKTDKTICKGGARAYDVNIRSTFAFREVGRGYSSIEKFAANMNMLQPVSTLQYHKINQKLHAAYVDTASKSMRAAAAEVKSLVLSDETAQDTADCQVSVDDTWQKRGFVSLNGIVTVISEENGKCTDIEVNIEVNIVTVVQYRIIKKVARSIKNGKLNIKHVVKQIIKNLLVQWKVLEQLLCLNDL